MVKWVNGYIKYNVIVINNNSSSTLTEFQGPTYIWETEYIILLVDRRRYSIQNMM
jgi:hypothetical protein